MNDFKEGYLLNRQEYGVLYPYVAAEEVRSFFWNGTRTMRMNPPPPRWEEVT